MKRATREWVRKAEDDFLAAQALSRQRKTPLRDAVCFHCQQSAEKYLKARMEEAGLRIPKTHDLEDLLALLVPFEPLWVALEPALRRLTPYGVKIRYPGSEATVPQVKVAKQDIKAIRKEARFALGL
ncbi:MAG: HEPN domain-containing protein [Verrucomicrobiaceae bacterium]|nr:HEPN domain-containing protein [Verrucomicrobiaceae bacterium]